MKFALEVIGNAVGGLIMALVYLAFCCVIAAYV